MASLGGSGEGGGREELKSQFSTREGTYRLASAVEFSRTTRPLTYVPPSNNTAPSPGTSPPVRISFVAHSSSTSASATDQNPSNPKSRTLDRPERDRGGGGAGAGHSNSNRSSPESPSPGPGPGGVSNNMGHHPATDYFPGSNGSASASATNSNHEDTNPDADSTPYRFCLNIGKELFVYPYMGVQKAVDMSKPMDKRVYKGTNPTCHDFNSVAASHDSLMLLIGFSGGQIQLVDPISKEVNKLYNEERVIDKARVTCIRWVPNSTTLFLVSYASGHIYLYNVDYPSGTTIPHYQVHKTGPGFTIFNCKSKTPRNPVNRWTLGDGAINEFAFSPCGQFFAAVSQDGFLRMFRFDTFELVGLTRSYFGGLLCVCWSPDGKYICVGGEDDLVTMWSFKERRVVARGQGHKSWVSVVAFDPVTTTYGDSDETDENGGAESCSCGTGGKCQSSTSNDCQSSGVFSCDSAETDSNSTSTLLQNSCAACQQISGKQSLVNHVNNNSNSSTTSTSTSTTTTINANATNSSSSTNVQLQHTCIPNFSRHSRHSRTTDSIGMRLSVSEAANTRVPACYRVGSVGQDTQICLWDLTEDVLKQPFGKNRPALRTGKNTSDMNSFINHSNPNPNPKSCNSNHQNQNNLPNFNSNSNSTASTNACKSHEKEDSSTSSSTCVGNSASASLKLNAGGSSTNINLTSTETNTNTNPSASNGNSSSNSNSVSGNSNSHGILSLRFGGLSFGGGDKNKDKDKEKEKDKDGKEHKRNFSLGSSNKDKNSGGNSKSTVGPASGFAALGLTIDKFDDPFKLIGTQACPRLDECPLLEPLICKKISHERLTTLIFREESIVTACQDGILCTWARPGDAVSQL